MAKKKILSVSDIEGAVDEKYSEIEAWGGVFLAGSLMAEDFIEWTEANDSPAKRTAGIRLITKSMCGPSATCPACNDGSDVHVGIHVRVGTDKHIEVFKRKSVAETEKVVKAIVKLNGLNVKGVDAPKND